MKDAGVDAELAELRAREEAPLSVEGVRECERAYDRLLEGRPYDAAALAQRNRFRLRNAGCVAPRPRVLLAPDGIGATDDLEAQACENRPHELDGALPLLRVADVVQLALAPATPRIDRAVLAHRDEPLDELLARLPFGIDLFLAPRVGAGDRLPIGLGGVPCATVAGIDGADGLGDRRAVERFDAVVPANERARELLAGVRGQDVLDWPGGLVEGSLHHVVPAGSTHERRDVDLSITFGADGATAAETEARRHAIATVRALEERSGGTCRVLVRHGAPRAQYLDVLRRSRVSLDVRDARTPGRRAREIVASGALLVSIGVGPAEPGPAGLAPGRHYVSCEAAGLEHALARCLDSGPDGGLDVARTAAAAFAHMREEQSFERLYTRLFGALRGSSATRARRLRMAGETAA